MQEVQLFVGVTRQGFQGLILGAEEVEPGEVGDEEEGGAVGPDEGVGAEREGDVVGGVEEVEG